MNDKHAQVIIKRDTEDNWKKATTYKPAFGTIILYETKQGISQLKIGDGETLVNDLPDIINNRPSTISDDGVLIL